MDKNTKISDGRREMYGNKKIVIPADKDKESILVLYLSVHSIPCFEA
ncbi:MAG: hypothetical protein J7J21_06890 [Methanomicrobia archaeon]|nr:hypothetical protein [Methanomicrobia archaeon]